MTSIYKRYWPGDPDRPAMALHCMLASGGYWGPIADRLQGCVDLVGFDMPGQGRSEPWAPGPTDPDYHTVVTRLAASFIDRPLDLIGHSMGATVALRLAVAAPHAIRTLTLIEPVLFAAAPSAEQSERDQEMNLLLSTEQEEEATRAFMAVWGDTPYDNMSARVQAQMRAAIRLVADTGPTIMNDTANLLRDGGLEAIDAPVMLISGQHSPSVIHDIADALAARLPDVGRATVPDAGHMLPMTHPDQVASLIKVNLERN